MSSLASLYVRGAAIFTWRNEIDPTFLFVFTANDVVRQPRDPDDVAYDGDEQAIFLRATAAVLSDRLDFLGVGRASTDARFRANVDEKLTSLRRIRSHLEPELIDPQIDLLKGLTLSAWSALLARALASADPSSSDRWTDPTSLQSLLDIWQDDDPRFLLRAVLLAIDPAEELRLDVSDLVDGGWIEEGFDPQAAALEHFSYAMANGSPAVVITEGSSDARCLQAALEVRYPHLVSFIKFFDFADGAEGSASAAVRTLKSFAAAGISNRVVLLLDNDSAARDAVRNLRAKRLPAQYTVLHYPDIELARHYPTLGPSGLSEMDVNGLAASVEMYLGADVLTAADGTLTPVQWRSYNEGVAAYQGEVMDKRGVQRRFKDKVKAAALNPSVIPSQDWSGIDAVVAALQTALSSAD